MNTPIIVKHRKFGSPDWKLDCFFENETEKEIVKALADQYGWSKIEYEICSNKSMAKVLIQDRLCSIRGLYREIKLLETI